MPHIDAKRPCALGARPHCSYSKLGSVALMLFALLALALFLSATLARLAAADRSAAGRTDPRLVLEEAGRHLGAIRNELAADALGIARAWMLAPALPRLHVVGPLRPGRRGPQRNAKRSCYQLPFTHENRSFVFRTFSPLGGGDLVAQSHRDKTSPNRRFRPF